MQILGENKQVRLHRLIFGIQDIDDSLIVGDHIYSDRKYDNRKQNLRITEQKHNTKNRIRPSNNTSGKLVYRGEKILINGLHILE